MARENPAYARIREEYATKYLIAREEADLRRAEIHLAIPEVAEIDRALGRTGLSLMEASMQGEDVQSRIAAVRRTNEDLRHVRAELLTSHGYPADYTEVRYECPLCNDSGFVDTRMCICMKKKLVEAGFEASGMGNLLREQSFENFDLTYYQSDPTALRRMEQILARMRLYTETFEAGKSGNLVLFGDTGLGKTHLSSAVARGVIERGCDVFYVSAVSMLSDFERERFGNSAGGETGVGTDRYFSCDLLIIDDLGTEVNNQFTTSVLYNLINTRLNKRQSTIINTNLTQDEFRKRYWDRITSRVLGEYTVLPFLGTDVRAQKLSRKN
ncbi:MAG: ATP-binding protein [Clostridia bacterium]|nr:ATP-binding protein [Clostridia bacterium]